MNTRREHDSLGEREVPAEAYYGIQTLRAVENFPISGLHADYAFVDATVQIKKAAAIVNHHLGLLDGAVSSAIVAACDEVLSGKLREWFVVDVYQAGAGTSHHMNVNEVLANRANEILGTGKGTYSPVHPNDHVNMAQSTNDVFPTAMRISSISRGHALAMQLDAMEQSFRARAIAFDHIVKSGRTHLADAVPVRLGQEFGAWATTMKKHREHLAAALDACRELGIGGTAAGTGLNAHPDYRGRMVAQLGVQLKEEFRGAENYFEAMESLRPIVAVSMAACNLAQDLIRIANDIRLMSSGPKTGLREITLPAVQPGSSIMPGKVNPVMAEMLTMVCFQVLGCNETIVLAAQAGQFELNVMMPVVAFNLVHALAIMSTALAAFRVKCVDGITADEERCNEFAEGSMSIVTALNPYIGYERSAELAKEYLATDSSLKELVRKRNVLSEEQIRQIFDLRGMTEPGIR
jgi:aspartate ammonia-lyase